MVDELKYLIFYGIPDIFELICGKWKNRNNHQLNSTHTRGNHLHDQALPPPGSIDNVQFPLTFFFEAKFVNTIKLGWT